MQALGADLIEHGQDFEEAREEAHRRATEANLVFVPSFAPDRADSDRARYRDEMALIVEDEAVQVPRARGRSRAKKKRTGIDTIILIGSARLSNAGEPNCPHTQLAPGAAACY